MANLLVFITLFFTAINFIQAQSSTKGNLITAGKNQCLEVKYGSLKNGQTIWTQTCSKTSSSQQWQFVKSNTSGKYVLQTSNNMCLDVPNGTASQAKQVQIWTCNKSSYHQFWTRDGKMIRYNGGKYCLNIRNAFKQGFPNGVVLQLYTCDSSNQNEQFSGPQSLTSVTTTTSSTTSKSTTKTTSSTTTTSSSASPSVTLPPSKIAKAPLSSIFNPSAKRMLAWGYDNNAAPMLGYGTQISTYTHWELPPIPQMPSRVLYIPEYWGTSKTSQWNTVKNGIGSSVPAAVMGFNEPDIPSQANMSPTTAAQVFYNEITQVYGIKGSNMIAPAIAWNIDGWLTPFMNACAKLGCGIDAIGLHMYINLAKDANNSTTTAVTLIKNYVTKAYNLYGKPIVFSELGLTQAGGGTPAQLVSFMTQAGAYLDNSPMILAWSLSGVFRQGNAWDSYMNSNMAFFNSDGSLSSLGRSYANATFSS